MASDQKLDALFEQLRTAESSARSWTKQINQGSHYTVEAANNMVRERAAAEAMVKGLRRQIAERKATLHAEAQARRTDERGGPHFPSAAIDRLVQRVVALEAHVERLQRDVASLRDSGHPASAIENPRAVGVVKWYSQAKGYGFITRVGAADLWVHRSAILEGEVLVEGDCVEFDVVSGPKGLQAANVKNVANR